MYIISKTLIRLLVFFDIRFYKINGYGGGNTTHCLISGNHHSIFSALTGDLSVLVPPDDFDRGVLSTGAEKVTG